MKQQQQQQQPLPPCPSPPQARYRQAYADGWLWGMVCGTCAGGSAMALLVWLVITMLDAWGCPTC